MDIVDQSKDEVTDVFVGNDNEHDILNTQLAVLNKLIELLRSGTFIYKINTSLDGSV